MTTRYELHIEEAKQIAAIYDAARGQAKQAEDWASEILVSWGIDPDRYDWRYRLVSKTILLRVYTGNTVLYLDYYALVKDMGDTRLCDLLSDAETLTIPKTLELPGLNTVLDLKARLPEPVILKLRKDGIITDHTSSAYVYATVECPIEAGASTKEEIPL